ncbi:hypothetical protein [Bradyrhizobium sp.]|uniref:hypothetical protein n=1 Tax=Bradyrhizobium sp. TaxID=376 RepID=UPI001EBBD406|nr:hypothetical protein [Bradyrhizobium sp.]MBV8920417.1 hypothetical protein [Bradyrhizobium sp.]MBV9981811.1 hypothetical protein [Bradyrhizobium sp.]
MIGLLLGIRDDAVVAAQGDTALRMVTLRRLEDRAGELGVGGTAKDAFDGIMAAVVPQLHAKRELFLWRGSPLTL